MNLKHEFTNLVYPFFHAIADEARDQRIRTLSERWNADAPATMKREKGATGLFLPHLSQILLPDSAGEEADNLPVRGWRAQRKELERVQERKANQIVRAECDLVALNIPASLNLVCASDEEGCTEPPFKAVVLLDHVRLYLFPQRVGFLVIRARIDPDSTGSSQLPRLLNCMRMLPQRRFGWQAKAIWEEEEEEFIHQFSIDLVDFLLQGLTEEGPPSCRDWREFRKRVREENPSAPLRRYSRTQSAQSYGRVFRLYTYAGTAECPVVACKSVDGWTCGECVTRALYELATCSDMRDEDSRPHPEGLRSVMEQGRIAVWANWEGMALYDNVVFLRIRAGAFTENILARAAESGYFLLFLLALYQKMRLSRLSGELMRSGQGLYRNLEDARSLWRRFIMFRNHFWFHEVARSKQGNTLYQRFQQGLDVVSLYESVSDEVRELQEYYERVSERRIGTLLNLLTFVGLPASLLIGIFSNALIKEATWTHFFVTGVVMYVITGLLWVAWNRFGKE